jgi:hypothetical protein
MIILALFVPPYLSEIENTFMSIVGDHEGGSLLSRRVLESKNSPLLRTSWSLGTMNTTYNCLRLPTQSSRIRQCQFSVLATNPPYWFAVSRGFLALAVAAKDLLCVDFVTRQRLHYQVARAVLLDLEFENSVTISFLGGAYSQVPSYCR